jgi:hypothetical protein
MLLLPYISQQPEGTWCEGMVHKRGTSSAQDISPQDSVGVDMVGILPSPSGIWSSLKSQDFASEWMILGHNHLNREQGGIRSLGYNYSYRVWQDMEE